MRKSKPLKKKTPRFKRKEDRRRVPKARRKANKLLH